MVDIFIYVSLALMILLFLLNWIIYRKLHVWKLIVILVIGLAYAFVRFFPIYVTFITIDDAKLYIAIAAYPATVVLALTFKRKIRITENLTDYDFFELEKELAEVKNSSDLLRLRYISTIGLIREGLIFYNEDLNGLFVTDQYLEIIDYDKNDLSMENYVDLIHSDDQSAYLSAIKKINKKNPNFDLKYRIKHEGVGVWVEERGKYFEFEKRPQIISAIKPIDIKLFPDTLIHEIDSLPTEQQLIQFLNLAMKNTEPFYLIMIQLTNIPDINGRFGRDVGNLMIAEYIKKMRYHFAKDVNSIFRVTGIQFALILKDQRKYDVLYRALQSGGDLINLMLNIGGIQQVVYPNLGIVKREPWDNYTLNELLSISNKSLNEAIRNPKKNYSVFGE
ncbi:MAG: PAS domain-containing protein [Bacilli bacterium]|nr:PAS domain-containing protein [Bacilli bacterium]MBN2696645.1 PAS domain-containing protein [Bacilli bacterium]